MTIKDLSKEIQNFINRITYMDNDTDMDYYDTIMFRTRENGNVGDEEFGSADWDEAQRVLTQVKSKYGEIFEFIDVEPCDEWVHLEMVLDVGYVEAYIKKRKVDKFVGKL